jgi:uncharacterized protein (DUF1330 family)
MPGYIISQVEVYDADEYAKYLAGFMDAFEPFDGRILVGTDNVTILEGKWPQVLTVVMEFPSKDRARDWYESEKYQRVAQHRFRSAKTNMILVDGYSDQSHTD